MNKNSRASTTLLSGLGPTFTILCLHLDLFISPPSHLHPQTNPHPQPRDTNKYTLLNHLVYYNSSVTKKAVKRKRTYTAIRICTLIVIDVIAAFCDGNTPFCGQVNLLQILAARAGWFVFSRNMASPDFVTFGIA